MRGAGLALGVLGALPARPRAQVSAAPVIAAAADLHFALEEIAAAFRGDSGSEVTLNFGSSGNFRRQIEQGAPFQLFLSADEAFVGQLAAAGYTLDEGTLYAIGRIVLFAGPDSPLAVDPALDGLAAGLAAGQVRKFAIANPEHAPYGRAAEQALRHRGLWERLQPHLILGENVAQAAQFAATGSAEGGIFAYSLALSEPMRKLGRCALIPADWHAPLRQRMVLLKGAGAVARSFYAYLQTAPARAVFRRYGFVLPEETG